MLAMYNSLENSLQSNHMRGIEIYRLEALEAQLIRRKDVSIEDNIKLCLCSV